MVSAAAQLQSPFTESGKWGLETACRARLRGPEPLPGLATELGAQCKMRQGTPCSNCIKT